MNPDELLEFMKLGVVLCGEFDEGAYSRYDEPCYCRCMAYFRVNTTFYKTPYGYGDTPQKAIDHLISNVRDKQRLNQIRNKFKEKTK